MPTSTRSHSRKPPMPRAAAWWLALCALVALIAGCADEPTRVYVTVEADAALAVDGLVVISGPNDRRSLPYTPRVELQVPDAWADAPHTVTVEGTHAGDVVARGSVTFTARAHASIDVTVQLAALGQCDATCEPGATRCAGGAEAVETCVVGTDGCPAWGAAEVCAGATPFCADGACVDTCQDDCTAGATECDGTGGVRTCGNHDGDSCLEWSTTTACGADLACTAGACVATVPLTVVKAGAGSGSVTSTPAGIDCGATCTARYLPGTAVTLTATPSMGATFTGWSGGGCGGTGTCVVTLATATTVTATFTGACMNECTAAATTCTSPSTQATCGNFDADACTEWGPATACGVNQVCAGTACVATATLTVARTGTGTGTITSSLPGITCGADCSESYPVGTMVTLTATPDASATFAGWSGGGCTGTGTCAVTLTAATTVTARFAGLCAPTACTTPPAPTCVDSETLRTFTSPGTCAGAACSYPSTDTACDGGCASGHCRIWTGALPTAGAPSPRSNHTAVWTGTEMIIWGGEDGSALLGDGARFNPSTGVWRPISSTGAPEPRSRHVAVWTGTEMIVWGGQSTSVAGDEAGGRYNPVTDTWTTIPARSTFGFYKRMDASAVWTGTRMIVWAGVRDTELGTGESYDPATGAWTALPSTGAPSARSRHSAVWTGSEMIVLGGYNNLIGTLADGGRYSPSTNAWVPLTAPSNWIYHTAVWTGTEMLVWDGDVGTRFAPATGMWRSMPTTGAPESRWNHSAVWTGSAMLVWGGVGGPTLGGTPTATGEIFQ